MKLKKRKKFATYDILNQDFVEWLIRQEMFLIAEDPGVPDDVERAATIIYNWYTTHDLHLPMKQDWRSDVQ